MHSHQARRRSETKLGDSDHRRGGNQALGKRIVQIVTENRDIRLKELKENLINRGHPSNNIDIAFNKIISANKQPNDKEKDLITLVHTFNPNHKFNTGIIINCLQNIKDKTDKSFWKQEDIGNH